MAERYGEINRAGARIVGISVDPPERNAAMVEKLGLPFPLLAAPGGERAIKPYGVWHEEPEIARPAIVVVSGDGAETFRVVSDDFADRVAEDELLEHLGELSLDPIEAEPVASGRAEPGKKAFPKEALVPYFRGTRFAAVSLGGRVSEAKETADRLTEQSDRYIKSAQELAA